MSRPRPGSGRREDRVLRKAVPLLVVVFVIFYLATDPEGAAEVTRAIGNAIGDFFNSLGRFLENLLSGS